MKSFMNLKYISAELDPKQIAENTFFNIDVIRNANDANPMIVNFLNRLEEHAKSNKMTFDEVNAILKWEMPRHPEWRIDPSKLKF